MLGSRFRQDRVRLGSRFRLDRFRLVLVSDRIKLG